MSFSGIIISIIILSILVIVHEYGHFLLARKNGIFVKEFSIGFGPRIISREMKSGTVFSWKAIPFGGSCTMLGEMEDEDDGTDDERSYDSKSVWARISVVLAGPFFNFFLAFVLSVIYIGTMGYDPPTVTHVVEGSPAYEAGLREGDLIVKYKGESVSFGRELFLENFTDPVTAKTKSVKITYVRDGKKYKIDVAPMEYTYYMLGISYYTNNDPAKIDEVGEGSALEEAGIKAGDTVTAVNGTTIVSGAELEKYFDEHPLTAEPVTISYMRRGGSYEAVVTPQPAQSYVTGFNYNRDNVRTTALGTLKYSFAELKYEIVAVLKSLGYLISGKGSLEMLSGPVGIVEAIDDTYTSSTGFGFVVTLMNLISIMILLSANLGVMNLLPIPALDGGKFILLVIEVITRKRVPKKVEGIVTIVGAALVFVLMAVVLVSDIRHLFH